MLWEFWKQTARLIIKKIKFQKKKAPLMSHNRHTWRLGRLRVQQFEKDVKKKLKNDSICFTKFYYLIRTTFSIHHLISEYNELIFLHQQRIFQLIISHITKLEYSLCNLKLKSWNYFNCQPRLRIQIVIVIQRLILSNS